MSANALVVEDRTEIAAMYARALTAAGFEVFMAFNLTDAYAILSEHFIDVCFLDLNLGEGESAQHTVRQIERIKLYNKDMTVIVVSGLLNDELTKIATLQGAAAVKEKLDMTRQVDLWRTVEQALSKAPETVLGRLQTPLELLRQLANKLGLL